MAKIKRETVRKRVRHDLLKQLEENNMTTAYWIDLVDDYLALWDAKEDLIRSIRENGTMISGRYGLKKNDAIAELPKVSKRMTDILVVLNIKFDDEEAVGDDV